MKFNWTRRNKLFAGIGGMVVVAAAALLAFTLVGMTEGGLFGTASVDPAVKTFNITRSVQSPAKHFEYWMKCEVSASVGIKKVELLRKREGGTWIIANSKQFDGNQKQWSGEFQDEPKTWNSAVSGYSYQGTYYYSIRIVDMQGKTVTETDCGLQQIKVIQI